MTAPAFDPTDPAALTVLAEAHWPEEGDGDPPALPGFVLSPFNPLTAAVAGRCLTRRHGTRPAPAEVGAETAVVLVSASGDRTSAGHVRQTVAAGGRPGPLLFYQSVPNSVVGHVAARWGLRGPVICLCPVGDAAAAARGEAVDLLRGGEAAEVLVVRVEEPAGEPPTASALIFGPPGTG
ncbi:beta-ketoacyl synthase chain length factor [Plantactinospora sp. WMMB334]|uniref:beta-ketoacyl synthase chain length factor n=1 Tax=Plantactinospora sp. WMMB334 TaxID=3404119 RepID=UPI003B95ED2F